MKWFCHCDDCGPTLGVHWFVAARVSHGRPRDKRSCTGGVQLHQPSTWTTVQWLKVPPPRTHRIRSGTAQALSYIQYWGMYTLGDETQGCPYIVALPETGDTTVTDSPRIPPEGATLPVDFGNVKSLRFKLENDRTGSGTVTLVHTDGSPAMTGTLTIMGGS